MRRFYITINRYQQKLSSVFPIFYQLLDENNKEDKAETTASTYLGVINKAEQKTVFNGVASVDANNLQQSKLESSSALLVEKDPPHDNTISKLEPLKHSKIGDKNDFDAKNTADVLKSEPEEVSPVAAKIPATFEKNISAHDNFKSSPSKYDYSPASSQSNSPLAAKKADSSNDYYSPVSLQANSPQVAKKVDQSFDDYSPASSQTNSPVALKLNPISTEHNFNATGDDDSSKGSRSSSGTFNAASPSGSGSGAPKSAWTRDSTAKGATTKAAVDSPAYKPYDDDEDEFELEVLDICNLVSILIFFFVCTDLVYLVR